MRTTCFTAAALASVLVACSSGSSPPPPASPSTQPSVVVAPPATTGAPSTGGPVAPRPVSLHHGGTVVKVTGAVKATLTLPLGAHGTYQPPPGSFSLSYVGRLGNALIVGGDTPDGKVRTSSTLTLSLVIQTPKRALPFPSARGECSITPTQETRTRIAAKFTCHNLKHAGKVIDATGTIVAFR